MKELYFEVTEMNHVFFSPIRDTRNQLLQVHPAIINNLLIRWLYYKFKWVVIGGVFIIRVDRRRNYRENIDEN